MSNVLQENLSATCEDPKLEIVERTWIEDKEIGKQAEKFDSLKEKKRTILTNTQLALTCSKSKIDALVKSVKYVQS